ncbi:MAG TPA: ATP-grasp domain-containing protein [Terriglobia bacterium]|nr:ATP-grasp domain-containing protein [Terriglobia bacterium]
MQEATLSKPHPVGTAPGRPSFDALILDAKLRQSLVTVRSLGRRGLRSAALETRTFARGVATFSSRWCAEEFVAPSYEHTPELFIEYLERVLETCHVKVLIPSHDGTLAIVRQYRKRLERRTRIAMADERALSIAVNKARTIALAQRLGLATPYGVSVNSVRELPAALREVGLPAVIKPVTTWTWGRNGEGKRLVCELVVNDEEARRAVGALTASGVAVLVQKFLSGEREAVSFLYANGNVYARFAQWAKRMQPPLGGTSVFRQSIAVPRDIGEPAERLIRAMELEGYSEIEFRRDASGKPHLIEINPRLSASVEVAVRAGVDFPYLLYQWSNGERIDRVETYRTGGWMRYLQGDLQTTLECFAQRGRPGVSPPVKALFDFATAFFVPSGYDYLDWQDLRPGLTAAGDFGRSIMRRLRKDNRPG